MSHRAVPESGLTLSTYLRKRGRLTRGQAKALESIGPDVLLPGDGSAPLDLSAVFGRAAPVGLEIGFGTGQSLLDWAAAAPDWNLLGIEVYEPGIGSLLKGMSERNLDNIRVISGDAAEVLESSIAAGAFQEVRVFFPDPWPKKRHWKRRLISDGFASLLVDRLGPGGRLRLATDWQDYATQMLRVLNGQSLLENEAGDGFAPRFEGRNITRFEARGQRLGHPVWDLSYQRR
jgi:tRNA (guanine-N7-)-methyltransferase